jgi:hypothetical protein
MHAVAERDQRRRTLPTASCKQELASVWIPWLAAPVFALLPLVGCWLAGCLQPVANPIVEQRPPDRTATSITLVSFAGVAQKR